MIDAKKSIWSWALYDWANSAFATTVMAGFFPLFFKAFWANQSHVAQSTFYLGMANSMASIIVAAIAPFLGAIADRGTAKRKFLMLFFFLGIISTGSLWMVQQGQWQMAVLFFVLATVGFAGGNIFYDALLPGVASNKKVDFASSLGFSMGYLGGGVLFAVNVVMYLKPEMFGIPNGTTAIKISFLSVAIWWAIFSVPLWLWVEEPKIYAPVGPIVAIKQGFDQIRGTLKEIKHLKVVGLFLAAYWLYIDGVDTIIRMAVDFGFAIGFPASTMITALLMVQFIAFPATMIFAGVSNKLGAKKAVLLAIAAYSCITILGALMYKQWHFYALAAGIGCFQGGIQAISRSLYARIIPASKSAQFYGLYNMMGKFAAVIGPALIGTIALITNNNRIGILSVLLLFISGFILLCFVNIEEGEKMAKKYLAD